MTAHGSPRRRSFLSFFSFCGTILNDSDVEFVDKPLAGIEVLEVLDLHDEADDIAALATGEALEDVLFGIEVERGLVVVMERTDTAAVELAHAVEVHAESVGYRENRQSSNIIFRYL